MFNTEGTQNLLDIFINAVLENFFCKVGEMFYNLALWKMYPETHGIFFAVSSCVMHKIVKEESHPSKNSQLRGGGGE
jgi:hypothetical protein